MKETSKTADKALAILTELADGQPSTPHQLSTRMEINRTVVQRLLTTLLERGFVTRAGGEYTLASRVRSLADAVQAPLRRVITPRIVALSARTGETVVFQIADGDDLTVLVEAVQARSIDLQARQEVGSRSPLVRSASGLAMLAAMNEANSTAILNTLAPGEETAQRLAAIRVSGYAITSNELQEGVSGLAVAVKVGDRVRGSVAVLVPSTRAAGLETMYPDLARSVARIQNDLARQGV